MNIDIVFVGYLFVIVSGSTAIILSSIEKMKNSTACTISGIGLLIGIFCVAGNRITAIETPLGKIITVVAEAEGKLEEIKKLQNSMEQIINNARIQTDEIENLKKMSDLVLNDTRTNLSITQKIQEEAPKLILILINKEEIRKKESYKLIKNTTPEQIESLNGRISELKNENTSLSRQLTIFKDN